MRIFLCGDLMLGRGIDQILPSPADPRLHEPYVRDAREYIEPAEEQNGPIPRGADFTYVWGDLLEVLHKRSPAARVGNLETSITTSDSHDITKGIHYRMSPSNAGVLSAASFDCLTLANNHVLDWGTEGLKETIATLDLEGIGRCGAGSTLSEAAAPCVIGDEGSEGEGSADRRAREGPRASIYGIGDRSSGVPRTWAARADNEGVWLKPGNSELSTHIAENAAGVRIASIHWGDNWGYDIPERRRRAAYTLIDQGGVSIVHGHSSHHPKGLEYYHGSLILYGVGDFLNDYEGIPGHERYRPELTLCYLLDIDATTGRVEAVEALVFRIRRFRLERASADETSWMADRMTQVSPGHVVQCTTAGEGSIIVSQGG